jgi:transposase-like protein
MTHTDNIHDAHDTQHAEPAVAGAGARGRILVKEKQPETQEEAVLYFSDPERAFEYALGVRWPDGRIRCPRCGSEEHSFLKTRRIWFCRGCRKQFSLKIGTIFEDSALGLDRWLLAMWMVAYRGEGLSSYRLARTVGITQKSAWSMLRRIREAQARGSLMKTRDDGLSAGEEAKTDGEVEGRSEEHEHQRHRIPGHQDGHVHEDPLTPKPAQKTRSTPGREGVGDSA